MPHLKSVLGFTNEEHCVADTKTYVAAYKEDICKYIENINRNSLQD